MANIHASCTPSRSSTKQDYASSHKCKELQWFILVENLDTRDWHHTYLSITLFTLMDTVLHVWWHENLEQRKSYCLQTSVMSQKKGFSPCCLQDKQQNHKWQNISLIINSLETLTACSLVHLQSLMRSGYTVLIHFRYIFSCPLYPGSPRKTEDRSWSTRRKCTVSHVILQ